MTYPCTKVLTAVHWSVNIFTTLHVIIKKICVKRDGIEGDDKGGDAGSMLSCGSLSGWGKYFQKLRRSLLSPWHQ